MTEKEINDFHKLLKKERRTAANRTKEESVAILKKTGILTKSGKIAKPYKDVFIPKWQTS